jgi:hypothetical protein
LSATELLISTFILLTNFSVSTGGYVLITYIILVPYLIKNEEYNKLLFFIFIIFALPVDWLYLIKIHNAYIYSYFNTITIYNPSRLWATVSIEYITSDAATQTASFYMVVANETSNITKSTIA